VRLCWNDGIRYTGSGPAIRVLDSGKPNLVGLRPLSYSRSSHANDPFRTNNSVPFTQPNSATGEFPAGVISYSPTSHVSAILISTTPSHRPLNIVWPGNLTQETEHDWALIGAHTLSYSGPITFTRIDKGATSGEINHGALTVANVPSLIGTTLTRNYTIFKEGGERFLSLAFSSRPGFRAELLWKKLE